MNIDREQILLKKSYLLTPRLKKNSKFYLNRLKLTSIDRSGYTLVITTTSVYKNGGYKTDEGAKDKYDSLHPTIEII